METDNLQLEHHEVIGQLASCPATSFHEYLVSDKIKNILVKSEIESIEDRYGNIVARVDGRGSDSKSIAFVAHMDHPGFEVNRMHSGKIIASALGGVPVAVFYQETTPAFSFDRNGVRLPCELLPFGPPEKREVEVVSDHDLPKETPIVFDLPDIDIHDQQINMRALDDIAGCASIISAMQEIKKNPSDTDVYAIFTRAEEVGLIGAKLLSESDLIPGDTIMVSVETSSVIPGVAQGNGPIIRTGDASYTFDAEAEQVIIRARDSIQKKQSEFASQRHLMSAGSCEASAFAANGFKSTGIAFPLGNWHNATTSIQDPSGSIGVEYISLMDYINGIKLIEISARSVSSVSESLNHRLRHVPDDYRMRLIVEG